MSDLISRQAAIDAIEHRLAEPAYQHEGEDWYTGMNCAESELYDLPSAQPEQRWIPCSERLPEPRIDVWCNSDMGQMVGYYEENVETWYGRDYLELMVTAWMPLPEPYKDGEQDG